MGRARGSASSVSLSNATARTMKLLLNPFQSDCTPCKRRGRISHLEILVQCQMVVNRWNIFNIQNLKEMNEANENLGKEKRSGKMCK